MLKAAALLGSTCDVSARRAAQQLSGRAHAVAVGCSRAALAGNGAPMLSFRAVHVSSAPTAAAQLWSKGKGMHASAIRGCVVPGDSREHSTGPLPASGGCARLMHFGSRVGKVANTLRSSASYSLGQRGGSCSVLEQRKQMGVASIGRHPLAALNAMRGAAVSLSGQSWAYMQVRGMVKTKSKASRNAAAAMQRADGSGYEVGKEIVLFTCYAATRFRLLSLAAACYISFSVWVYYMHYYGDMGLGNDMPTMYGLIVTTGLVMSLAATGVLWYHARRHVASLSVTPHKLIDEVTMVTHTMFGGTVSKHFMPNRIVKRAVADDKGEAKQAPWQRFKVAGENGFFLLDDKGEVHDQKLLDALLGGRFTPLPRKSQH